MEIRKSPNSYFDMEKYIDNTMDQDQELHQDQGNLIGKMIVRKTDIDKWQEWISEKCPNEIKH
jgi:hypothetical protein